jgi:GrpB-like predicted nucleotidyltransferase (UPF0157 family)
MSGVCPSGGRRERYVPAVPDRRAFQAHVDFDPDGVEPVTARPPRPLVVVEYDPAWPAQFERLRARLVAALGPRALAVEHVGSTSVPGLAAKPVIDVDLVVADSADEGAYVDDLVGAGFPLLLRERGWHEHRLFGSDDPYGNIHVFGPDSPEVARNVLFRDWLRQHPEDCERYVAAKREAVAATLAEVEAGATAPAEVRAGRMYNAHKQPVIRDILDRAIAALPD